MLEKLKEMLADNWKGAVAGGVAAAVVLLGLVPTNVVFKVATSLSDEDPRVELCKDFEAPVAEEGSEEEASEEEEVAVADEPVVEEEAADVGTSD